MEMSKIREFGLRLVAKSLTGTIFVSILSVASSHAVAGGFNWGAAAAGAAAGAGQAASEMADQDLRLKQQKQQMEYQYELERLRIQRQQHELELQRQQRAFEQQRIPDENARKVASPKATEAPSNYSAERERRETAKLTVLHPDWQSIIRLPQFVYWRDNVITDGKALMNSEDADFISRHLTQFKAWRRTSGQ